MRRECDRPIPGFDLVERECVGCHHLFGAHRLSRTVLCCACRPMAVEGRRLRILPRVDRMPNAISSLKELREYFDHDELECLICGERSAGLYRHILMAHGVSAREYRMAFDIPQTHGLIGKATRAKMEKSAKATVKKMKSKGFKNLQRARKARAIAMNAKVRKRTAWPSYMARDHAAKLVLSPKHPSRREGVDVLACAGCGEPVVRNAKSAVAVMCRVKCEDCQRALKREREGHDG